MTNHLNALAIEKDFSLAPRKRRLEFTRSRAVPVFEGSVERAGLRIAEQIGDFLDGHVAGAKVLASQLHSNIVVDLAEARSGSLQSSPQCSRRHHQ